MAISRAQLAKELEPGLNALFGLEYDRYENEHSEIFGNLYGSLQYGNNSSCFLYYGRSY